MRDAYEPAAGIVYEVDGPLAILRLERPAQLNAFTYEMLRAFRAATRRAVEDERVLAIAVTGTGRAFCAGLDAGDLAHSRAHGVPADLFDASDPDELPALFQFLPRLPKPTIAALNGVAAGGGFVLAMMCDLRFAADDATLTTIFSKRGLIAEHGTSWLLPRLVGTSRALDLLWSSRRIDAAEAHRIGFVDRVCAKERLLDDVRSYVAELTANVSPRSIAVMKSQVYRGLSMPIGDALRDADREMKRALESRDAKEGVAALLERRAPNFPRLT
jgi:enoyl-CoA hydratase/carnithine racemase